MSRLQSQAMLVTLSVSCWTARVQDKKVAAEVDAAHNARDAGRYNKLLVDKAYMDPLVSFGGAVRAYHYKMTLPWMDGGSRLLPSALFMEYSTEIRRLKSEYTALVSKFITEYDAKLVQAARVRLGTMYDPADYPPGHELRGKFSIDLQIVPVPSGSDFRVDIGDAEKARIQKEITEKVAEREIAATKDAWTRVRDTVGLMAERLSAEKSRVHDSLVDNTRDLARLLPGLNVTNDPQMDKVCSVMIEKLLVSASQLRSSATKRREVAAAARGVLEMIPA